MASLSCAGWEQEKISVMGSDSFLSLINSVQGC